MLLCRDASQYLERVLDGEERQDWHVFESIFLAAQSKPQWGSALDCMAAETAELHQIDELNLQVLDKDVSWHCPVQQLSGA